MFRRTGVVRWLPLLAVFLLLTLATAGCGHSGY